MKIKLQNTMTNTSFLLFIEEYGNQFAVKKHSYEKNTVFIGNIKDCLEQYSILKDKYLKNNSHSIVFEKNSLINKISLKNKNKLPNKTIKRPKTDDHHVGIEIEFLSPLNTKAIALVIKQLKLTKFVNLKHDDSIIPEWTGKLQKYRLLYPEQSITGHFGHEITLLCKEDEVNDLMKKIKILFKKVRAKTNSTCSVHIHLDMRNRDVRHCYKNLVHSQSLFFRMNPYRKNNIYCKPGKITDFDLALAKYIRKKQYRYNSNHARYNYGYYNRYLAVNPHSYSAFKTLEVRVHEGTTNTTAIKNWTNMLIQLASYKEQLPNCAKNVNKLLNVDKLFSQSTLNYINNTI